MRIKLTLLILLITSALILLGCTQPPVCGNGICEVGETPENCNAETGGDCSSELMTCSALGGITCQPSEECSTYTLPVSDSNFCCIQGNCIPNQTNRVQDFNGVFVIQENYEGEFTYLIEDSNYMGIEDEKLFEIFFAEYPDEYDFIMFTPKFGMRFHRNLSVNINMQGVGLDLQESSNFTKKLKSSLVLDLSGVYLTDSPLFQEMFLKVASHEIAHHWCCFPKGILLNQAVSMPTHWVSYVDLFYSDPNKVDIMGYDQWIVVDQNLNCLNNNEIDPNDNIFSDLSLYLMGLIPPEEVRPIKVYDFEMKPEYNYLGPTCEDETPTLLDTIEVTIEDIILNNGERIPTYQNSQKDFKLAWIVLLKYGQTLDENFVEYIRLYKNQLPSSWAKETSYKSRLID